MKADLIFTCWATTLPSDMRRFDVVAADHESAVLAGFAKFPNASSVSCRATDVAEERRHG